MPDGQCCETHQEVSEYPKGFSNLSNFSDTLNIAIMAGVKVEVAAPDKREDVIIVTFSKRGKKRVVKSSVTLLKVDTTSAVDFRLGEALGNLALKDEAAQSAQDSSDQTDGSEASE